MARRRNSRMDILTGNRLKHSAGDRYLRAASVISPYPSLSIGTDLSEVICFKPSPVPGVPLMRSPCRLQLVLEVLCLDLRNDPMAVSRF